MKTINGFDRTTVEEIRKEFDALVETFAKERGLTYVKHNSTFEKAEVNLKCTLKVEGVSTFKEKSENYLLALYGLKIGDKVLVPGYGECTITGYNSRSKRSIELKSDKESLRGTTSLVQKHLVK